MAVPVLGRGKEVPNPHVPAPELAQLPTRPLRRGLATTCSGGLWRGPFTANPSPVFPATPSVSLHH